ncbi:MAG: cyanophycinase [Clostridia bacterium]|nr:cyanophycinase [Clostridia bacterium]MDD4679604.1 cyanophycinase [Clostridia bacterium]
MEEDKQGILIIIGGKEDKKNECIILKKVAELAGGAESKIVILTVATDYPSEVGREYKRLFHKLKVSQVEALHIETRENANDIDRLERLGGASCVFFTGGDQLKITSLTGGTKIEEFLRESFTEGLIIAGTSAGASVMSETMITSGDDDKAPRRCTVKMAPGIGLIDGVVIDQHFAERGRIGRLLAAVSQNPKVLGIGIDEDTAIVVRPNHSFEVLGSNAVTVLDGINCSYTNVSESHPDDILAFTDVVLHILPAGYEYDLLCRLPMLRR